MFNNVQRNWRNCKKHLNASESSSNELSNEEDNTFNKTIFDPTSDDDEGDFKAKRKK